MFSDAAKPTLSFEQINGIIQENLPGILGWIEAGQSEATRPQTLTPIGGGKSNASMFQWQPEAGVNLVIRSLKHMLDTSKPREMECSQLAGGSTIGPDVYHTTPDNNYMVTAFVTGSTLTYTELHTETETMVNVLKIMKNLHELEPPTTQAVSYIERIERHLERGKITFNPEMSGAFEACKQKIKPTSLGNGFTHNDIHPGNIMQTESRLYLIDWTDAGLGDKLADVALFSAEFEDDAALEILKEYLNDRNPDPDLIEQFNYRRQLIYMLRAAFAYEQVVIKFGKEKFDQLKDTKVDEEIDSYQKVFAAFRNGKFDFNTPETWMQFAHACLNSVDREMLSKPQPAAVQPSTLSS